MIWDEWYEEEAQSFEESSFNFDFSSLLSKPKDYYKILEVDYHANDDSIRSNYIRLALKWHPDKKKDEDTATLRFQDINEAYTVLSDPVKRREYDKHGMLYVYDHNIIEYLNRYKGLILTCNGLGVKQSIVEYYKILEVDYHANDDSIRSNYIRLALKWHPDKKKDEDTATLRFQDINEAYTVLSDPVKRREYDKHGMLYVYDHNIIEYLNRYKGLILTCNGLGVKQSIVEYYKILEVDYHANDDSIRSNYIRLALKWHPDKKKDEDTATLRFQDINEAYTVLSDPVKRREYDKHGMLYVYDHNIIEYLNRYKGLILTCNGLGVKQSIV